MAHQYLRCLKLATTASANRSPQEKSINQKDGLPLQQMGNIYLVPVDFALVCCNFFCACWTHAAFSKSAATLQSIDCISGAATS
jgi:hypothetical protein